MTTITLNNQDEWMPQAGLASKWTGGTWAEQLVLALQMDGLTCETICDQQVWDKINELEQVIEEA